MIGQKRQYRSKKHKEKWRRALLIWGGIGAGLLLVLLAALIYLSNREEFQITEIQVSGNSVVTTEEIVALANKVLEGRYWTFVPRSNSFFAPHAEIQNVLKDSFPRFSLVDVHYESAQVLRISVVERAPAALWCGVEPTPGETDECYFVDSGGVVYAKAPFFSGDVFVRLYAPKDGVHIMSPEDIATVLTIGSFLHEGDGEVSAFVLDSPKEGHFKVRTFNDDTLLNTDILITLKEDAEISIENLSTLLETDTRKTSTVLPMEGEGIKKPQVYQYEYIDLRFGSKVYFRERP